MMPVARALLMLGCPHRMGADTHGAIAVDYGVSGCGTFL